MRLSEEMIRAGSLTGGALKKAQLALLGVKWPPRKGWIQRLVGKEIDAETYRRFLALKGAPEKDRRCPKCGTVVHGTVPLGLGEVCPLCQSKAAREPVQNRGSPAQRVELRRRRAGCDLCSERDEAVRYFEDAGVRRCAGCYAAMVRAELLSEEEGDRFPEWMGPHLDALALGNLLDAVRFVGKG